MGEFASKGVAGAALGTGIGGLLWVSSMAPAACSI